MARSEQSDSRLRTVLYSADEIYRLRGYVGYQIDLEFAPDESFVGLGAGDLESLSFTAEANHLFIKPRAAHVHTNLTVLTTRHNYHFEYSAAAEVPDPDRVDVVYALRFSYAQPSAMLPSPATLVPSVAEVLSAESTQRGRNFDYWYCGRPEIEPKAAWDDGVHTHLAFSPRTELPAVFVRNDDASESLINFTIVGEEIVVHRIARQFVLRRGGLVGCIVNRGFAGGGSRLDSGTVAPEIRRALRETPDEAIR